jgi:hypothetical protein
VTGDGRPDLAVANKGSNTVSVFLNTTAPGATTPSFSSPQTFAVGSQPVSVTLQDINGDGRPDLIVANSYGGTGGTVSVLLNTTAPGATLASFGPQQSFATGKDPYAVALADLTGDGRPDLVVANRLGYNVSVLVNTTTPGATTASFASQKTFATGAKPYAVAEGDLNGDGRPDLVVANSNGNYVSVLLNTTAPGATVPSFAAQTTFATNGYCDSVALADFSGDGRLDLVTANPTKNTVSVLLNTTPPGASSPSFGPNFTFATGHDPRSVIAVDIDGDGRPDLVVGNGTSSYASVLVNTTMPGAPSPSFAAQQTVATGSGAASLAVTDLNGDGLPDLVLADSSASAASALLNTAIPVTISNGMATGMIVQDETPQTLDLVAGTNNQTATVGTAFGQNLAVVVVAMDGDPVQGVSVTFTAPASGASGTFAGGKTSVTIASDPTGTATAPVFTANNASGTYTVTAAATGGSNPTAGFTLINTTGTITTSTTLASSISPSIFGQPVTIVAVVSGSSSSGGPTGKVTFLNGAATLGTGTVNSFGYAAFTTSTLTVGTEAIQALYSGDANFIGSTSGTLTQTVSQAGSTTTVATSANPAVFGQRVIFFVAERAAAPGSGTPTGTVTFKDGTTTVGTAVLSSGRASFTTSTLIVGTHAITVVYAGDANFKTSTSATLGQTVNKANTTTIVFNPVNPSVFGQEVVFTALVSAVAPGAGTPGGTVTFKDGTTTLGTAVLGNGRATLTKFGLSVGTHAITVSYAGDANFNTSASNTLTQTVNPDNTLTLVLSSVNPSVVGQAVIFTALVNPLPQGSGTPTGTVTFKDGTTTLGTGTLKANSNGTGSTATFSISTLTAGTHPITAVYAGDANFKTSTSGTLTQTVTAAASATTLVSAANTAPNRPAPSAYRSDTPAVFHAGELDTAPKRQRGRVPSSPALWVGGGTPGAEPTAKILAALDLYFAFYQAGPVGLDGED